MKTEKFLDDDVAYVLFDLGDGSIGAVDTAEQPFRMELWHDHGHDGSGCNNWEIDALGRALDLEFYASRELDHAENDAVVKALRDPFVGTYRGCDIERLFPSGYFESYTGATFRKADTLDGIRGWIDQDLGEEDSE